MTETVTHLDAPEGALCLHCNYLLRGLPTDRCPECGKRFDPTDPWTMNCGRPLGTIARFLFSPIGWPTVVVASVATATTVWWTSYLTGAQRAMVVALSLWAAIYFYRVIRAIVRWTVARRYRQRIHNHRLRALPALLALSGLLMWTQAPLRVLLLFHANAYERLSKHYYRETPMLNPPSAPDRVGLFECGKVEVNANGVALQMGELSFEYDPFHCRWFGDKARIIRSGDYYVTDEGFESETLARPIDLVLHSNRLR